MALRFLGFLFLAVGLYLLWSAGSDLVRARRLGANATGTVVAVREVRSRSEMGNRRQVSLTYAPVVRFPGPGGTPVEFVSGRSSAPARYHLGETVPVVYDHGDPKKAEIGEFAEIGFLPTLSGGMGLLACLLALVAFWGARREAAGRYGPPPPTFPSDSFSS